MMLVFTTNSWAPTQKDLVSMLIFPAKKINNNMEIF